MLNRLLHLRARNDLSKDWWKELISEAKKYFERKNYQERVGATRLIPFIDGELQPAYLVRFLDDLQLGYPDQALLDFADYCSSESGE